MDCVRGFAGDANSTAHGLQPIEMRLDCPLLVRDRARQQIERIPGRDETQAVWLENLLQRLRIPGKLVAVLNAVEADLAGLAQASLQRDVRTEAPVVVVRPGDRVGAIEDHFLSFSAAS